MNREDARRAPGARRGACVLSVALLLFGAEAQGQVVLDGTTGPAGALAGPDIAIGAALGRRAGDNLFHSFAYFDLARGERATFSGPAAIANVIARVTGGERSDIDGALRSTIPDAALWFFNPAGVAFGPNATLDLQGALHVSTADELRFADGARFSATDPALSTFTTAPPEAFGFLGRSPAALRVSDAVLQAPPEQALSLIGGPLEISGGPASFISAFGGTINLVGVSAPGEVRLADGNLGTPPVERLGAVRITDDAFVFSGLFAPDADGRAAIRVRAGELLVDDAQLSLDNFTDEDLAGTIAVDAAEVVIRNTDVTADALGAGAAGRIRIGAGRMRLEEAAVVRSDTLAGGAAGTVEVTIGGGHLALLEGSRISSLTSGAGPAGAVEVSVPAGRVELRDGSFLASSSSGAGAGGTVRVRAGQVLADGGGDVARAGIATLTGGGGGPAGRIVVEADSVDLVAGGVLSSTTSGPGGGGSIVVDVDRLAVDGALSRIDSTTATGASGDGGDVRITAGGRLEVTEGGLIASGTLDQGAGGRTAIDAGEMVLDGAGAAATGITTLAGPGAGPAGRILVRADALAVRNGASITAGTSGDFDGGPITLVVRRGDLDLAGGVLSSSTLGAGAAGPIAIEVRRGEAALRSGAQIASNSFAAGPGGNIVIEAERLRVEGASISAGAFASGAGGLIEVTTREGTRLAEDGRITSSASGTGDAGAITLAAGGALVLRRATISSGAERSGGGRITITAADLIELRDAEIGTSVARLAGRAGDIDIDPRFLVLDRGNILARADAGIGGDIRIAADNLLLAPGSLINAEAGETGVDGTVVVSAPEVDLSGGLVVLESAFLDAASLLRERCAARRDVEASSFTGAGRGGLPANPDGPLLSSYADGESAAPPGGPVAVPDGHDFPDVVVVARCGGPVAAGHG